MVRSLYAPRHNISSWCWAMTKKIVIDGKGHLMGRLAAICAKELLEGNELVVVRCEDIFISGPFARNRKKFQDFLRLRSNTNPSKHSHIHHRFPSAMFKRVVRGMLPHKTPKGATALGRLTTIEGIPPAWNRRTRVVVPQALKCLRLRVSSAYTRLGDLAASVGWKQGPIIERLEAVRRERNQKRYEAKKQTMEETAAKREQVIKNAPADIKEGLALLA